MTAPARTQKLTAPGDLHTIKIGTIRLTAQLTTDGGITLTIWAGTHRRAFDYNDKAEGRHAYNIIRQMASTGLTADQIADAINADRDHARAQFRKVLEDAQEYTAGGDSLTDTAISTALADEIDRLRGARERDDMAALVADMRRHLGYGDCAADGPDVDPDDAPTNVPMTSAPPPTDTPTETVDKPRNLRDAYGTRTPNRVTATKRLRRTTSERIDDMRAELHANGRIDLTHADGHDHRTAQALIRRGWATPIKTTNARPGQRTLTAITLPGDPR